MPTPYIQLAARLAMYLAAEEKVLEGQEYVIGNGGSSRRLRRADLADIRAEIASLNSQIASAPDNPANTGRHKPRRVTYLRAN